MTQEDTKQDKAIASIKEALDKKVPWTVFVWAIALIILIIGWVISSVVSAKTDNSVTINRVSSVEGDIKAMKSDISWIRTYMEKNQR